MAKSLAGGVIVAAGLGVSPGASAQTPRIYSLTVPVEIEHDSNPNLVVGGSPSTNWLRVRPTFTARQVEGIHEFAVEAAVSAEKSSNHDVAKDRVDPRLRGSWKRADGVNTTQLYAVYDRRAFRALDVTRRIPSGVDGTRTLYSLGGSWSRDLSERTAITADLRQDWERYNAGTSPDFRFTTGSVRLTRQENERRSWYVSANGQRYRSETRQDPLLGPVAGTRSDVAGAVVGVNQAFSDALRVEANVGAMNFSGSGSGTEWQGLLKADYTADRWLATAELSRSPGVNSEAGGLVINEGRRLRLQYALAALSRLEFDAARSSEKAIHSVRTQFRAAYVRQLSPSWEFSLRATRQQQESLAGTARGNLIALVLVYIAPDL
jgi:hypothetical protein